MLSVPADRMSPPSPTSLMASRRKSVVPPGFRAAPRPRQRPITQMSVRELEDLHLLNAKILSTPGASTSTYVNRALSEQAAIETRLVELVGVEELNARLKSASIKELSVPRDAPVSRAIAAKQKALSNFAPSHENGASGTMSFQEAVNLEQEAHMREKERLERITEKKRRLGMPIKGEVLTRQEMEARIWAFMNHKPTDSDMEDDDDESDDDPASWFEDDQDDGRKGQDIVEPDVEDLSDIIRVDYSRIHSSTFYKPHHDGD